MSERLPKLLIADIIESSNKILQYTEGLSYYEFIENHLVRDAVMRNFEIIGEAAKRLPEEIKYKNSDIDWIGICGFRNRIAHDYFGIEYRIVWLIKESFLPDLLLKMKQIEL
ncbi:MAG: DUF86 domain-containing protein [Bacteroidota bacterium]|nr:DUF86 domain-containing protein [Bacteroidota bacterium]